MLFKSSTTTEISTDTIIYRFIATQTDYSSDPVNHKSTSGIIVKYENSTVHRRLNKQSTIATSIAKVNINTVVLGLVELRLINDILNDLVDTKNVLIIINNNQAFLANLDSNS